MCQQRPTRSPAGNPAVILVITLQSVLLTGNVSSHAQDTVCYPGTAPLTVQGDIASEMVDGVDRFLLSKLRASVEQRAGHWQRELSSAAAYTMSVQPNRDRLAHILGVRDERLPWKALQLAATTDQPAKVGESDTFEVLAVRWPVISHVHGEGLLLLPKDRDPVAYIVAVPDADQTPEMLAGLTAGIPASSQFARRLAESGCCVLVPTLINREMKPRNGRAVLTNREYVYRSAFELGRHLIGYEVQKIQSAIDWFAHETGRAGSRIGVIGWGEGGMLALYAAALDSRIDATCVSGYFGSRQDIWQEPIDRNVFGLLEQFGDAELATLVAPRALIVEAVAGPQLELSGQGGGAPARLVSPTSDEVRRECGRARALTRGLQSPWDFITTEFATGTRVIGSDTTLKRFLTMLGVEGPLSPSHTSPQSLRAEFDPSVRQQRQVDEIDDHNQWLLRESPYVRAEFMNQLNTDSLEQYQESVEWYRNYFRDEVIGHFDDPLSEPRPRSRQVYDEARWVGYEVMLDVFPDVFAYGILCVPKNITVGERRPVVVCQHGLEGRPGQVVVGNHRAYHDFAAKLAEQGFITFAPQNIYIFKDRFRTLQRKANPLKKTLFSIMVPQHQQIVNWLKTLPIVDTDRIGFYGLSYGGKSAMRIPALVTDYSLSICSADFNEWVGKNASTRSKYSYVWTGEYEIFEFDLGSTFSYSEMAALIAPRPFMVERGHFDGVASDEAVASEFAKVRHLYNARLGIGERAEIEWFVGPHTINGVGTFRFLHKHLRKHGLRNEP